MRILYLTEEPITFSGTMVRGGQIHVRNVVEGLREYGHDVHLVDWNRKSEREFQYSVQPRFRFVVDPMRTLFRAVSVGQASDVDVVISKTRKTYLPGLLAARRLDVPHIVHVGSSPGKTGSGKFGQVDSASIITRLKFPHDGYFVVCNAIAKDLEKLGVSGDRIFDVKNAVDTDRFQPDCISVKVDDTYQRQIEAVGNNGFLLGFIGGLQAYKGLDDLANALDETEANCSVVVAGDGPERDRLERKFGDRASFLGPVPYEQIPGIYNQVDALVLPSHTEGLPRVVLEAQATGTPVIATRVGGLPEIIEDGKTGMLVDARSPDQLAAAIDRIASDSNLQSKLGKMGRRAVVESYSWESMYERYERFLTDVVNNAGHDE